MGPGGGLSTGPGGGLSTGPGGGLSTGPGGGLSTDRGTEMLSNDAWLVEFYGHDTKGFRWVCVAKTNAERGYRWSFLVITSIRWVKQMCAKRSSVHCSAI